MERKEDMTPAERKQYRLDNYRAELKTRESSVFRVIASGKEDYPDTERNLATLESIRRVVYPELSRGVRMDRGLVKIIRG